MWVLIFFIIIIIILRSRLCNDADCRGRWSVTGDVDVFFVTPYLRSIEFHNRTTETMVQTQ